MHLEEGLVFISDSRTNAGIDQTSSFRKLFIFRTPGKRLIAVQTAGNLATSKSVINLLRQRPLGGAFAERRNTLRCDGTDCRYPARGHDERPEQADS